MALKDLRDKIDIVDKNILDLLNERANLSIQIIKEKKKNNLPVFDPEREKKIFSKMYNDNQGPLLNKQLELIFQAILKVSRNIQKNAEGNTSC